MAVSILKPKSLRTFEPLDINLPLSTLRGPRKRAPLLN